jgi:hypothetical protein
MQKEGLRKMPFILWLFLVQQDGKSRATVAVSK